MPKQYIKIRGANEHNLKNISLDLPAALRAVGDTDPRVQKTHIVVYLRHSSYGGTRVAVRGFLVDGDRRGKSLDAINIRFFHLA